LKFPFWTPLEDDRPMASAAGTAARERNQQRRYGRLGGLLFGAAALSTLPAALLLEPVPGADILLVTVLGVSSGIICWFVPWERMPNWSLDVLTTVGTLEVLLACHVVDATYRLLYALVVVFAALALPTRGRVVAQVVIVLLALAEPVTHDAGAREHARVALLFAPVLVIVAAAVRYLRETLEMRDRASRAFAREAIELAIRLRRGTPGGEHRRSAELADLERAVERLR
jgi:hypothetical protein